MGKAGWDGRGRSGCEGRSPQKWVELWSQRLYYLSAFWALFYASLFEFSSLLCRGVALSLLCRGVALSLLLLSSFPSLLCHPPPPAPPPPLENQLRETILGTRATSLLIKENDDARDEDLSANVASSVRCDELNARYDPLTSFLSILLDVR